MRTCEKSTAHYRETIADLRSKLAEADKRAAKLRRMIDDLHDLYGDPFAAVTEHQPSAESDQESPDDNHPPMDGGAAYSLHIADVIHKLPLSEACLAVMRDAARPMTNREILDALRSRHFHLRFMFGLLVSHSWLA